MSYYGWNPSDKDADISLSVDDHVASITAAAGSLRAVIGRDAAQNYYFEIVTGGSTLHLVGILKTGDSLANYTGTTANGYGYYDNAGQKYNNNVGAAYGATWTVGDVVGIRLSAGVLTFYKNGVSQGTAYSGLSGVFYPSWGPGTSGAGTRTATINTGDTPLKYLPIGSSAWGGSGGISVAMISEFGMV